MPERDTPPFAAVLALRVLFGTALVAAAFGLWVAPSGAGDSGMMLMKLLVSLALFWSGVLCLLPSADRDDRPSVELDPHSRTLRVIYPEPAGGTSRLVEHDIDSMAELSLRDRLLTARDHDGRQLVVIEVQDARAERMLQRALSLAA